ncbi:MAG: purine-nucleoside phosphorylase, partial [Chloroflexi bacterium]|nr:purine-nucleoside phosphorylase [Chloroflexota bacterium]
MRDWFTMEEIDESVQAILTRTKIRPQVGIILGSGLGGLADAVENPDSISFGEIPYWVSSTVQGHVGRIVLGQLEGKS